MDTPEVVVKNIFSDHGYGYGGYGYGGGHGGGYNGGNGGDYGFGHQLSDISSKVDTNAVLNGISGLVSGQHGLSNEICGTGRDILRGQHELSREVGGSSRDVLGSVADVKTSLTGQNFTNLQSLNDGIRDVIAKSTSSDFQNLNSFNNTNSNMMSWFNNSNDRQQNATNLIISQGRDLAAQLAECCCRTELQLADFKASTNDKFCDVKELIRADGQTTRALMEDIRRHELETQLADAKLAIALAGNGNK